MKHLFKSFYALIFVCLSLSSCSENQKIKKTMTEFMKTEVVLPDSLECIYSGEISMISKETLKSNKYIIYYDSNDCSSCRIARLIELSPLYDIADSSDISVVTLFAPKQDDIKNVRLQLQISDLAFPVYLDVENSFKDSNPDLPSDIRFHSFMINSDGYPILVGNPVYSEQINKLFKVTLNKFN